MADRPQSELERELAGGSDRRAPRLGLDVLEARQAHAEQPHGPGRRVGAQQRDVATVIEVAVELLRAYAPARPVRLLGVRLAGFEDVEAEPRRAPVAATRQLALEL